MASWQTNKKVDWNDISDYFIFSLFKLSSFHACCWWILHVFSHFCYAQHLCFFKNRVFLSLLFNDKINFKWQIFRFVASSSNEKWMARWELWGLWRLLFVFIKSSEFFSSGVLNGLINYYGEVVSHQTFSFFSLIIC